MAYSVIMAAKIAVMNIVLIAHTFDACFQQYSFCQKFNMKINSVFSIDL